MSTRIAEEDDLETGTSSLIDNLLTRRRHSGEEENGLVRRGGGSDGNRRRASTLSTRRESGTLFHPLSNLIPVPASDLITTSALPHNESNANTHLG